MSGNMQPRLICSLNAGRNLLLVVAVSFGLLCVLQALLNISLRLIGESFLFIFSFQKQFIRLFCQQEMFQS